MVRQVIEFLSSTGRLFDELGAGQLAPDRLQVVIAAAANLAGEHDLGSGSAQRKVLADLVDRVVVGTSSIEVHLKRVALAARLLGDGVAPAGCDDPIVIEAPIRIARRGVETRLVIEGAAEREPDPALVKAVARGNGWFDDLVSGRAKSIAEIAEREGLTGRYVARLLDLAFLPPALAEDIVAGRQPVEMTAETLSRSERSLVWVGD